MIGKKLISALSLALGLAAAAPASAITLLADTHTYGIGAYDPSGSDQLRNGSVRVATNSSVSFFDGFDFTSLTYSTVETLTLTLNYTGVDSGILERWMVNVFANATSPTGASFAPIQLTGTTITLLAQGTALATIMNTSQLGFGFSGSGFGNQRFDLASATLVIDGTPAPTGVPLPASGLLLLFALTGPLAMRSKRLRRMFFD